MALNKLVQITSKVPALLEKNQSEISTNQEKKFRKLSFEEIISKIPCTFLKIICPIISPPPPGFSNFSI